MEKWAKGKRWCWIGILAVLLALAGGAPGACGRNGVERAGGAREPLAGRATVDLGVDDVLVIETPGGGGFGPAPGSS